MSLNRPLPNPPFPYYPSGLFREVGKVKKMSRKRRTRRGVVSKVCFQENEWRKKYSNKDKLDVDWKDFKSFVVRDLDASLENKLSVIFQNPSTSITQPC